MTTRLHKGVSSVDEIPDLAEIYDPKKVRQKSMKNELEYYCKHNLDSCFNSKRSLNCMISTHSDKAEAIARPSTSNQNTSFSRS